MSTYEVSVDSNRCLGYATCIGIAPDVFTLPKDSPVAVVITQTVGEDRVEDIQEAIRNCAARAISMHAVG